MGGNLTEWHWVGWGEAKISDEVKSTLISNTILLETNESYASDAILSYPLQFLYGVISELKNFCQDAILFVDHIVVPWLMEESREAIAHLRTRLVAG